MSDYLTVQEVAALARCEHKAVRRAITAGRLPAFRTAGRLLVRDDAARAWIEDRPTAASTRTRPSKPRSIRSRERAGAGSVAFLKQLEREAS